MYRVSPFTYLVSGMLSTSVANADIICAANEYLVMQPPSGSTCGQYLSDYVDMAGGYVLDGNATNDCQLCPLNSTNSYLDGLSISFNDAWRNFGFIWVYVAVNVVGALAIYWLARMPKKVNAEKEKKA